MVAAPLLIPFEIRFWIWVKGSWVRRAAERCAFALLETLDMDPMDN